MDHVKGTCRACSSSLKSKKSVKLSSRIQRKRVTYQDAFFACTGFSLKEMEPQELCEECASELRISFQFKEKCQTTQNKLKNLLEESEATKLEEDVIEVNSLEEISHEEVETHIVPCKKRKESQKKVCNKTLCPVCGELRSASHTKHHLAKQTGQKYICDICGNTLATKPILLTHMRMFHLKVPYTCKHCTRTFPNNSQLHIHMRKIHPEVKELLKCHLCDFQTIYYAKLRIHRMRHTGKLDYKCEICGKEFFAKYRLRDHMATHSDEKPFACETCGSTYKTRRYLLVHMRVHQTRNYECPVCQRTFLTNQLMRHHVKTLHPEHQLPPPGTVMSKSWRRKMAEIKMKEDAMKKGQPQQVVDAIVVTEAPSIEDFHCFNPF